eukprot:358404-Chlamydomonas_euryale.AAC.3
MHAHLTTLAAVPSLSLSQQNPPPWLRPCSHRSGRRPSDPCARQHSATASDQGEARAASRRRQLPPQKTTRQCACTGHAREGRGGPGRQRTRGARTWHARSAAPRLEGGASRRCVFNSASRAAYSLKSQRTRRSPGPPCLRARVGASLPPESRSAAPAQLGRRSHAEARLPQSPARRRPTPALRPSTRRTAKNPLGLPQRDLQHALQVASHHAVLVFESLRRSAVGAVEGGPSAELGARARRRDKWPGDATAAKFVGALRLLTSTTSFHQRSMRAPTALSRIDRFAHWEVGNVQRRRKDLTV